MEIIDEEKEAKEKLPLPLQWKIFAFLFSGMITVFIAGYYKWNGYSRKHEEIWRWSFYGCCFYVVMFLLFYLLVRIIL